MIGKIENDIIDNGACDETDVDKEAIEQYLLEVKSAVRNNRYRIDRSSKRQANEAKAKEIILSLTVMDFSKILRNEHKGFEHERLYVFGKDVRLLERSGTKERTVSLYIKFNKLEDCYVIVISFHEQRYPLTYYFR